jgi:hypothetical protein
MEQNYKEYLKMRRIYLSILITGILLAFTTPVKAQISFKLGFGISSQPVWGPSGYDEAQYYYLPDIDTYYYVPQHRFYYQVRGRWISSSQLPSRYRNYDLYSGYKVVINADRPYMHDREYREKYSSYKNRHDQQPIRDSRDSKYFVNKNHPEHNNWVKQQRHDNNQGNKRQQDIRREKNDRHEQDFRHDQGNKQGQNDRKNQNRKQNQENKQHNKDRNGKK